MSPTIHNIPVQGIELDPQTRCAHYHSAVDVIAIKFKCCQTYYACYSCHEALAGHPSEVWPREEFHQKAILCGVCGAQLTISQYLQCNARCPHCSTQFNPRCQNHRHLYFGEVHGPVS